MIPYDLHLLGSALAGLIGGLLLCYLYHWYARRSRDPLSVRARALIHDADAMDASGEAKRHKVYAALIKEFPKTSKRVIALTIEDVMRTI